MAVKQVCVPHAKHQTRTLIFVDKPTVLSVKMEKLQTKNGQVVNHHLGERAR
jgi:hypothetical protein